MFSATPELPVSMGVEKQAANQSCVGTQLQKNFTPGVFALRKEKKKQGLGRFKGLGTCNRLEISASRASAQAVSGRPFMILTERR